MEWFHGVSSSWGCGVASKLTNGFLYYTPQSVRWGQRNQAAKQCRHEVRLPRLVSIYAVADHATKGGLRHLCLLATKSSNDNCSLASALQVACTSPREKRPLSGIQHLRVFWASFHSTGGISAAPDGVGHILDHVR